MRCPHCDSKITKKNKFCPECGITVVFEEKNNSQASTPKGIRMLIVIGILLLVVIISVGTLIAFGGIEGIKEAIITGKIPTTTAFSNDPDAITLASKSVVKLNCYDKSGNLYATGSAFACFEDNIFVTNYHVIQDNVYSIEASTEDGTKFDVTNVVVADKDRDIAILATATPHGLTLLQPDSSNNLQKGEKVVAIGSPLGLLNSVSTGVFSGYTNENGMDVLQFTAPISSGSSGGTLFNDAGEVLGITYASYEAGQNLNLAIPIAEVVRIWNNKPNHRISIKTFYWHQTPTCSVDYVIANAEAFDLRTITIEGFVSYTHGYTVDGQPHQNFGVVADQSDVFGSVFTDYEWDYNAAAAVDLDPAVTGITIVVMPQKNVDMTQFLDRYKPGAYVTCTGKFQKITSFFGDTIFLLYVE